MPLETTPKLYTDEDVDVRLSVALRQQGFDVKSTLEAGHCGASDEEQLEFSMQEERVLLTHNIKDFVRLHRRYFHENKVHSGILVCNQNEVQGNLPKLLKLTKNFLERTSKENMQGKLKHLEEFK